MRDVKASLTTKAADDRLIALCGQAESIMGDSPVSEKAAEAVMALFKGRRFAGTRFERLIRLMQMVCSSWLRDGAGMKRFAAAAERAPESDLPDLEGVPVKALCALYRTAADIIRVTPKPGEEPEMDEKAARALWNEADDAFFYIVSDVRNYNCHATAVLGAMRAALPALEDTAVPYALGAAANLCEDEMPRAIKYACMALDEIRSGKPFTEGIPDLIACTLFGALYATAEDEPKLRVPKKFTAAHSDEKILLYLRAKLSEGDAAVIDFARKGPRWRITGTAADLLASCLAAESLEKADADLLRRAALIVAGDDRDLGASPFRRLVRARIYMQSGEPKKAVRECNAALKRLAKHCIWGDLRAILLETGAFARIRQKGGFKSSDVLDYCNEAPWRLRTKALRLIQAHSLLNCAVYPDLAGRIAEASDIALDNLNEDPKNAGALSCFKRCLLMMHRDKDALTVAEKIPPLLEGEDRAQAEAECRSIAEDLAKRKGQVKAFEPQRERFLKAVEREIGPVADVITGWYPIEIWIVLPKKAPGMQYAMTYGLQLFGEAGRKPHRRELIVPLPAEKDLSGYRFAPRDFWPITEMAKIAVQACRMPGRHVEEGLTVRNVDGTPLGPGAPFTGTMLCAFGEAGAISKKFPAELLELVPIYPEEGDFVALFGPEPLRERLAATSYRPVSEHRPNVCLDRRYRPLIERSRLKPVCPAEKSVLMAFVNLDILTEGRELRYMVRHRPQPGDRDWNSGWHFYTGEETDRVIEDKTSFPLVDLNTIANYAPDIVPLLDAPYGSSYVRRDDGVMVPLEEVPPEKRHRPGGRTLS
jgi:hypothetical protein